MKSEQRFLSVDPLTQSYPMLTPYQFASNRPIDGVDLDGLEYMEQKSILIFSGDPALETISAEDVLISNATVWNAATIGLDLDVNLPTSVARETSQFNIGNTNRNKLMSHANSKYETNEVKLLRIDTRAHEKSERTRMTANSNVAALNFASVLNDALAGAFKLVHLYKNGEQIAHASESVFAIMQAKNLMKKVLDDNLLPPEIANNLALTQRLTNFLVDGTGKVDENQEVAPVQKLISNVGSSIYENREQIMNGTFNFYSEFDQIGCNGCGDTDHPILFPIFRQRSSTTEAYKSIQYYLELIKKPQDNGSIKSNN